MAQKLLIIKNNNTDIQKISECLNSHFSEIEIFSTSNDSNLLNKVKSVIPDIIIFDIDQAKDQIGENLSVIVQILRIKPFPIIVLSSTNDYKRVLKSGAINFIQKPYSEITLVSNFKTAINLIEILKSISIKEKVIEEKNQKIQMQIKNENIQREIIIKKNKEIMADIRYASRIQQAIFPSANLINELFHEYFILHQPKSHVSGDFYWISHKNNIKIIVVGDCTGHGISGGLMHMLGSAYLNEIIANGNFKTASDILEQLRDQIMRSLNQTGEMGETQDGLDIALCIVDDENKTLQFSGANNPLYLIRNKELIEIKGDRMPVGIHINFNKPFTNHILDFHSNDQFYLFSDGYADQFGGPRGKKFRYKQFKELVQSVSHEPMNIQKEILTNIQDKWRGSLEQIDDILVFGLKIK
ncbi:MAG: SpoIIE family protein phosphatase [Bacteroidales bacterium]|jgi:serine phosphatase RsbU (regulator of sigma subunit)|nr:SpoIIE family protein phosphatase [Bacteroidales bacterium]